MVGFDEICACDYETEEEICGCGLRKEQAGKKCWRCKRGEHAMDAKDPKPAEKVK